MVYCVMAPNVAARVRRSLERGVARTEGLTLIAERRGRERRSGAERRTRQALRRRIVELRRIVYADGRRVAERRSVLVPVQPPDDLPRPLRHHAGALSFYEPLEFPRHLCDDVDAVRTIVRYQAGEGFEELYSRWVDPLYAYLRVTLERGEDVESAVAAVLGEALRQLPAAAPAPAEVRPWLFGLAYDATRVGAGAAARPRSVGRDAAAEGTEDEEEDALTWLSDDDLLLLVERRPRLERHVLVLRYFAGLSFIEIAEVMRVAPAEAAALHRAAVAALDATLAAVTRAPRIQDRHPMGRLTHQTPVLQRRRRALLAT